MSIEHEIIRHNFCLFTGTSPHGIGIQDTERESSNSRMNNSRSSPFEKFRQMEQNKEVSQSSDRQR